MLASMLYYLDKYLVNLQRDSWFWSDGSKFDYIHVHALDDSNESGRTSYLMMNFGSRINIDLDRSQSLLLSDCSVAPQVIMVGLVLSVICKPSSSAL